MKSITFCIATAKNEKEYVTLLLQSLKDHTNFLSHEVLVFIDSDNQNTHERLLEMQGSGFTNLKICKNPNKYPIGGQRNISVMFNAAKNDIVCYLQSDMVVGKDFDKHILANINEGTVVSCARIEPPLHPTSPEKIVKDFGITPKTFNYQEFNLFVDELQKENRPNMVGHFAPFAVFKNTWINKLGGFDTQFRCSREDSDTIIRMELNGLNMIQSWNACVYHFTCVSSRGSDWFEKTAQAEYKNILQQLADAEELKRFIRKWGFFGHHPRPVYDITLEVDLDQFVDMGLLEAIEPYVSKLWLNNKSVATALANSIEFKAHYYSNLRWNYTPEHWDGVKHLFNPTNFHNKITTKPATEEQCDIKISIKYSELVANWNEDIRFFIENIHSVIHQNEQGSFQYGPFSIDINTKNNLTPSFALNSNIKQLLSEQLFEFK